MFTSKIDIYNEYKKFLIEYFQKDKKQLFTNGISDDGDPEYVYIFFEILFTFVYSKINIFCNGNEPWWNIEIIRKNFIKLINKISASAVTVISLNENNFLQSLKNEYPDLNYNVINSSIFEENCMNPQLYKQFIITWDTGGLRNEFYPSKMKSIIYINNKKLHDSIDNSINWDNLKKAKLKVKRKRIQLK